jgi:hypothetical protein
MLRSWRIRPAIARERAAAGHTVRLDDVPIAGVLNATIEATMSRHRVPPMGWLLGRGVLLVV